MNKIDPLKIFISVGEESADLHASKLCEELMVLSPNIDLFGFGGAKMKSAGVDILYPLPELALIGFVEVIKKLPTVFKIKNFALKIWEERKPDAVILVDFPGFHLRLARLAKEKGIPVLYYIAPQVWAWREKRVEIMQQTLSKLLVIFPFEESYFQRHGIPAKYVGHPLAERISMAPLDEQTDFTPPESPTIGLLPGSRKNELQNMLPTMIQAAKLLKTKLPSAHFILFLAESLTETILPKFKIPNWIEVCQDSNYSRRKSLDFAWTCSGTATVENALLGIPMTIVYRTGRINMSIGRRLVRVPYIGMVNLVAQKGICPEYIQEQCQPEVLAQSAEEILTSPFLYQEMKADLKTVRHKIGEQKASVNAAREILSFMKKVKI